MSEENKRLIYRWFEEVWNNKSESTIDEMCAEDVIANGLTDEDGNTIQGIAAYKDLQRKFVMAYPDIKITVEDTISEGDKVAARCRVSGTHEGEGLGLAPTNKAIEFTGMTIVRLENGKITEAWNEFDFLRMYNQLGAATLNLK